MDSTTRTLRLLFLIVFGLSLPAAALAECGGQTQCIGVGSTPAAADIAHHGNGPATLGLRAEAAYSTSFGQAMPYLRVEYNHDLSENPQSTMIFANQPAGTPFTFSPGAYTGNNAILLGIGSDFLLRSGLKFGIDYQTQRTSGPVNSQAIRIWMTKVLDGKGVLDNTSSHSGLITASLFDNPVRIETGWIRDDNINRASDGSDKLADNTYSFSANKSMVIPTSQHTRMLISGFLGADKQQQYDGLDRVSGGLNGELKYRSSGAFDATTYALFARVSHDRYKSSLRSGNRFSAGINARQSLTDSMDIFGALSSNMRNADNSVFSTRDNSLRFNFDFRPDRSGTVYLGGEYRLGDTVSTSTASIHSAALADVIVKDDAFGIGERNAYRFEARTTLITLGYNLALGSRDSLDLFWRRIDTTSIKAPNYPALPVSYLGKTGPAGPDGPVYYLSNQVGITYLMRF